jgi:hypothetical protein
MLRYKQKISKKLALEKIYTHAFAGNHGENPRPRTVQDVQTFFARHGANLDQIAELCRDPNQAIPFLENLMGSTWTALSSGTGHVSIQDQEGKRVANVQGKGQLVQSTYWALFEAACAARNRAVKDGSYIDFQTAVVQGIASIEAFVSALAEAWNAKHPNETLIDSKDSKVSFDDKINHWIPKIIGNTFNKGDKRWSEFVELRRIRDHLAIHPKVSAYGIEEADLANKINLFRYGIAGFLERLHTISRQPIPAVIINAVYMPDVEIVEQS